jgi:hypothetical protein
VLELPRSPPPE